MVSMRLLVLHDPGFHMGGRGGGGGGHWELPLEYHVIITFKQGIMAVGIRHADTKLLDNEDSTNMYFWHLDCITIILRGTNFQIILWRRTPRPY